MAFSTKTSSGTSPMLRPTYCRKVQFDSNLTISKCDFGQRLGGIFNRNKFRDISYVKAHIFQKSLMRLRFDHFQMRFWSTFILGGICHYLLSSDKLSVNLQGPWSYFFFFRRFGFRTISLERLDRLP